jgi:Arm DNA-binding domain
VKLSQRMLETLALPAGKTEVILFDDDLPGFGIRIRSSGARTWIYQYKLGTRHRRLTLGNVGALALVQARKIAGELHAKDRLGRDPAGEKDEGRSRAAETVGAVLESYLPHKKANMRPRSYLETERHLLRHCRVLHRLPLEVNRRAIATRLAANTVSSGPTAANRVRDSLQAFFSWTIAQGLLVSNGFIGSLVSAGAFDAMLSSMTPLPMRLAVVGAITTSVTAYQIFESTVKRVSSLAFSNQNSDPLKVVSMLVLSKELVHAAPADHYGQPMMGKKERRALQAKEAIRGTVWEDLIRDPQEANGADGRDG